MSSSSVSPSYPPPPSKMSKKRLAFSSSHLLLLPLFRSLLPVSLTLTRVFQWVPEITHHCPKTPFLLVGTQIDLRDDPSTIEKLAKNKQKPITPETAEKLARDLKAVKYVECSALTQVRPHTRIQTHTHNPHTVTSRETRVHNTPPA